MNSQARAILVLQWRILLNFYRVNGRTMLVLNLILQSVWYIGFIFMGTVVSMALSEPRFLPQVREYLPLGLLGIFLYWQFVPLMVASVGGLLEIKKLQVYPIPEHQLYRVELLLRATLLPEVIVLLLFATVGVLRNPELPWWASLPLIVYLLFNLYLSAGFRDLISRLFAKKGLREAVFLLFILATAAPQILFRTGMPKWVPQWFDKLSLIALPWVAAGRLASGEPSALAWLVLLAWLGFGWWFGRYQFHKSLVFDESAQRAKDETGARNAGRFEWFFTWPNRVFRDPLAAMIEKEMRFLTRTPPFRIVFLMGFTFGLMIWLPMLIGSPERRVSFLADHLLVFTSLYALLLLSGVLFVNCFGFDRAAAQMYFVAPVERALVFRAKNIAAAFFVFLEVSIIALVCVAFRIRITGAHLAEAVLATAIFTLFMLGYGNIASVRAPRPLDPTKAAGRNRNSKFNFVLVLVMPLMTLPIGLAYLAQYAFDSDVAFFAVLCFGVFLAAAFYWVALDSALRTFDERKEQVLGLLAQGEGPVSIV